MNTYTVYMHTVPNGLVYIGITRQNPPERRWGCDGKKYRNNPRFWEAIQQYGWSNIQHDILYTDLSAEEAKEKERDLIKSHNSMDSKYGYNHTSGGDVSTQQFSDEVREILRQHTTSMWKDPVIRGRIVSGLKGHTVSDLTRKKISLKNKGRKLNHPSPLKGRKLSAEHIAKLKQQIPWCKGLTKDDPRVMAISVALKGRTFSAEHNAKLSRSKKLKYQNGYKPVWVSNGVTETLVSDVDVDKYLAMGYVLGRLNLKSVYITNGTVTKKISPTELEHYISMGWHQGKDNTASANIAKSRVQYTYTYDSHQFDSCKDILVYLKDNGYPCISLSSVIKIAAGGFVERYADLCGKITRVHV